MQKERRKRWLRARCTKCRGFLKVRQEEGKWVAKPISCHCPSGSQFRFSRPRPGGKVRK